MTDRTFARLLWHLARKRSGSILTTPEPAWATQQRSTTLKWLLQCIMTSAIACSTNGQTDHCQSDLHSVMWGLVA